MFDAKLRKRFLLTNILIKKNKVKLRYAKKVLYLHYLTLAKGES